MTGYQCSWWMGRVIRLEWMAREWHSALGEGSGSSEWTCFSDLLLVISDWATRLQRDVGEWVVFLSECGPGDFESLTQC